MCGLGDCIVSFDFVIMMFGAVFPAMTFGSICMIWFVSSDSTLIFVCRFREKFDMRNCLMDFITKDVSNRFVSQSGCHVRSI